MRKAVQTIAEWRTDEAKLSTSYRRLAETRYPVNLYSTRTQVQRQAAALLHGIDGRASSWEELDGRQLADDQYGTRTTLLLGGAAGAVVLPSASGSGLLAAAGTGTLLLTHIEKLPPAAQRVLCRIVETRRYTPVGDPFPRPINCRIVTVTQQPLLTLARNFQIEWNLAQALGSIALRAESLMSVLGKEEFYDSHSSTFAAAS
jgi:transcriptional regulator of acetoin/glycerol metabolism